MKRYLYDSIEKLALKRNKMAFISGPRQVGKTTLAKSFKNDFSAFSYRNWDDVEFRRIWTNSPNDLKNDFKIEAVHANGLLVLDEIRKAKGWKQKVKGLFDLHHDDLNIIVTGSARLNVFKKGGDSLMGRYLSFRLHPFSYGETLEGVSSSPERWRSALYEKSKAVFRQKEFNNLFRFSGFPEPYSAASEQILNIWRRSRNEKIVRQDLRDLSRLPELSQVEMLTSLLPSKVGSPLSVQSLREDLEVAHDTVSRWLRYLNELFYFFEIKPWIKSVPRSLKKEGEIYLYDWTEIESDGAKFENFIACHLLKACHFWTDTGLGFFDLHYLRNKEKEEINFLISRENKPWLCIEAQVSDLQIEKKKVDKFRSYLKCPFVQVVKTAGIWRNDDGRLLISADRFLRDLP